MKIILTCGHPYAGFLRVHELLATAGLEQLQPAAQEPATAIELRERLFAALGVPQDGIDAGAQLRPGPEWRAVAEQLLGANQQQADCGWADAGGVWLLEFWKSLSPAIRFVLVYSAPEQAIGDMISRTEGELGDIDRLAAGWVANNNEMLRFYHRNRDRCQLVNACAAAESPTRLIESISAAFGMVLSADGFPDRAPHVRHSAVAASLSYSLIEGFDDVLALYRELESSADIEGAAVGDPAGEKQRAWREYTALTADLDAVRNDAAGQKDKNMALQRECEASEAKLVDLRRELEQTRLALKTAEDTALRRHHDLSQMQTKNAELDQTSQLQALQVKQVQEELGHYFSRYQELLDRHKADTREMLVFRRFWRSNQPAESVIDLKGEIDGDNWYYPEKDGRWAGPGDVSTLNLPRLLPGDYKLQIDVVDAMEPEILAGMEVAVNGMVLELTHQGRGYPARAYARFSVDEAESRTLWEIRFKFPKLVCPAQHGSSDQRLLAVRVQSLRLTLLALMDRPSLSKYVTDLLRR